MAYGLKACSCHPVSGKYDVTCSAINNCKVGRGVHREVFFSKFGHDLKVDLHEQIYTLKKKKKKKNYFISSVSFTSYYMKGRKAEMRNFNDKKKIHEQV